MFCIGGNIEPPISMGFGSKSSIEGAAVVDTGDASATADGAGVVAGVWAGVVIALPKSGPVSMYRGAWILGSGAAATVGAACGAVP